MIVINNLIAYFRSKLELLYVCILGLKKGVCESKLVKSECKSETFFS